MKFRDVLALGRKKLKKQPDETLKEVEAAWVDSLIFRFLDFPRFNPDGSLSLWACAVKALSRILRTKGENHKIIIS